MDLKNLISNLAIVYICMVRNLNLMRPEELIENLTSWLTREGS